MKRRSTPLFFLLSLAFTTGAVRADVRGQDRRGGARVILYEHENFQGASLVVPAGESIENLAQVAFEGGRSANDRISSVRIEGGAEIYLYEDSRYRGHVIRLTEDVRNLTGKLLPESVAANWNDRVSSVKVARPTGRASRVKPDEIVKRAYRDLLGRDPDPVGQSHFRVLIAEQGWTDEMVRDNIRASPEYRNEGANRIVRQAYLDVLGREPDPSGLAHYRKLLVDKGWTGGQVQDDLRKSDEYRRRAQAKPGG